jgi:hypothetical protein
MNTTTSPSFTLTEDDQFFVENDVVIKRLVAARNNFLSKLQSRVIELQATIEGSGLVPFTVVKKGISARDSLYYDFKINGHDVAIFIYISPEGWTLRIIPRESNRESQENLKTLLKDRCNELTFDPRACT